MTKIYTAKCALSSVLNHPDWHTCIVTVICLIINQFCLFRLMSPSPPGNADNPSSPEPEVLEGQGSCNLEGWWLKLSQFHGLIVKRFHCAKRNTKGLFSQILLPAFFVCVAMTVALSVPEIGEISTIMVMCRFLSCLSGQSELPLLLLSAISEKAGECTLWYWWHV